MNIKDVRKEYPNKDLNIIWQPKKCIHSEKCWRGLSTVFKYGQRPWVDPEGASSEAIKNQIDQCPSGALSYEMKNSEKENNTMSNTTITIAKNGPLLIKGNIEIQLTDGTIKEEKTTALCRCGSSSNKPYCDGTHSKVNFSG
jgi:uncharacterized Fe-S cluster protein YjdI